MRQARGQGGFARGRGTGDGDAGPVTHAIKSALSAGASLAGFPHRGLQRPGYAGSSPAEAEKSRAPRAPFPDGNEGPPAASAVPRNRGESKGFWPETGAF